MLCNVNIFSSAFAIFMKLLLTHNFVNKLLFTTASTLLVLYHSNPIFVFFFTLWKLIHSSIILTSFYQSSHTRNVYFATIKV